MQLKDSFFNNKAIYASRYVQLYVNMAKENLLSKPIETEVEIVDT